MILNNEQQEFIKNNYKGRTVGELTNLINNTYKTNFGINQVRNFKKMKRYKSNINTRFKKGQKPFNYKPVGYEFINSDGYVEVKVADPNKWELKQRYIYKKYKGNIPKGYSVIFADGDRKNFDIDNLILIRDKEKLVMKNKHLFFNNRKMTESGILLAKIINKMSELTKERNKKK